jgi:hypothetical protein
VTAHVDYFFHFFLVCTDFCAFQPFFAEHGVEGFFG